VELKNHFKVIKSLREALNLTANARLTSVWLSAD